MKSRRVFCQALAVAVTVLILCPLLGGTTADAAEAGRIGIFTEINRDEVDRLSGYDTVIIDPSAFLASDIRAIHDKGITVYGYINVGSIETFRPYYSRFKQYALGRYDGWDNERWIDVSKKEWQSFIVRKLAGQYAAEGIDGFFVDNIDVYYNYCRDSIYRGLVSILTGIEDYGIPVIVNGGDTFVKRALSEKKASKLFDGICQESVFTSATGIQKKSVTRYYRSYLKKVRRAGFDVIIVEYGADRALSKRIKSFCRKNRYSCVLM